MTNWKVVSNDGDTVILRREDEDTMQEAELQRSSTVSQTAWRKKWTVGTEFTAQEFREARNAEVALRGQNGELW